MASTPTVSDPRKAAAISEDEINAVVDAVQADVATEASSLMQ
ncbi:MULTISPECIES: hypothetical protein [unclassified Methylobacterium]|nr:MULTISPECIES: hypothetical protein [unclassified Methylobacterium]